MEYDINYIRLSEHEYSSLCELRMFIAIKYPQIWKEINKHLEDINKSWKEAIDIVKSKCEDSMK